jgi:hypothetical protein
MTKMWWGSCSTLEHIPIELNMIHDSWIKLDAPQQILYFYLCQPSLLNQTEFERGLVALKIIFIFPSI